MSALILRGQRRRLLRAAAAAVVNVSPNKRWHASNDLKVNKLSNFKKYSTDEYLALEIESLWSCMYIV